MLPSRDLSTYDVILLADMARQSDCGLRMRRELQSYREMGYRAALRHLGAPGAKRPILPDIQRCVKDGLADLIGPDQPVQAKLALVFSPGHMKEPVSGLSGIRADRVILVQDRAPNAAQMGLWFNFNFGPISWAPTNRWVRAKLEELQYPVPIEAEDWRPIGVPLPLSPAAAKPRSGLVIGRVSAAGAAQWSKTAKELNEIYRPAPGIEFRMMGLPASDLLKESKVAAKWTSVGATDSSVERFLQALDVFMYFPSASAPELPDAAIASAMASDKIVVLPPNLRPHFGPGALYVEPQDALDAITALFADETALNDQREAARYHCKFQFSAEAHATRIKALIGPATAAPAVQRGAQQDKDRILFVPSNGVGLGHATRLLAIARRLDDTFEPIFTSFGQAQGIIESFGYTAEYTPSYTDLGTNVSDWDAWLRCELSDAIDRYRPKAVVYDGNNPTPGLVNAALADGQCMLAWVRRAMCPTVPSQFLDNARFFDCIIEPGEYAGERDIGPTVARRDEVTAVPPVRLLDDHEVLPKDVAMKRLGLSADRPAALIHLGAGSNRDILHLIDRIITELRRFDGLQIVIAEWSNAAMRMPHWPGTTVLRGFPISQFFNAFDFSVAAAGYNTFHDVIGFDLPTIFIPNRHPSMDDQGARAEFAQDHSAGFDLAEDELHLFPALCEALLTEQANQVLRQSCATFDKTNGAAEAASILKRMVGMI